MSASGRRVPEPLRRPSDGDFAPDAAADAAARSADLLDSDGELAAVACEQGALFTEASVADLEALRAAVESVYTDLKSDPVTAS